MEDLGRGGEEKNGGKGGGGSYFIRKSIRNSGRVSCFFVREGLGVGRFHQRAKGVAADFSERGGGREGGNDYVCHGKFERKRATGLSMDRERERESDVKKRGTDERMERKDDTERERKKGEREKKDIASRWTRRLAFTVSEASLAANGERGFRPCVERRWERAEWRDRERERAAIGHGRSI